MNIVTDRFAERYNIVAQRDIMVKYFVRAEWLDIARCILFLPA